MKERISELVWLYIKKRPFLREILREKIINYSSLARKICIEVFGNKRNFNAVKMALQRMSSKLERKEADLEKDILEVLSRSSIIMRSKVAVVISSVPVGNIAPISAANSGKFMTYIIKHEDLAKFKKSRSIRLIQDNRNLITISSPEELEDVPGVIAMLLNLLASEGINVDEFISCYTDTLLVIRESDTSRAYELLSSIMK